MNLTDEQIRIAIAEACGWKWSKPYYDHGGIWRSSPYRGNDIWDSDISKWAGTPENVQRDTHELPDYLSDLNAMHEAEKVLTDEQQVEFAYDLKEIACPITGEDWSAIHATARQRALALFNVLNVSKSSKSNRPETL